MSKNPGDMFVRSCMYYPSQLLNLRVADKIESLILEHRDHNMWEAVTKSFSFLTTN
jgi:hypothetical protein